ncbi:MAG: 2,3-diaminopropionate biosynthesis protein SbnA [Chloroflexota bacterium]
MLSTIGQTPLIRLTHVLPNMHFQLFAKLETFNPGGSIKDRTAVNIIYDALERGQIQPGGTIIESSSGNLGIGLAQACAYMGLHFICIVDPRTNVQNMDIMRVYGATVDLITEPHPITGDFLQARIERAQYLAETIPNSFWCNQYANLANPHAHHQTMHEIATNLHGKVDYLFCATSTCGTLRGCAEYIRRYELDTTVIAVDAVGSVIFGGKPGPRLLPGHGAGRRPEHYQDDLADEYIHVSDLECVVGCRRLVRHEAILAGASSGGIITALDRLKDTIKPNANCVLILCDRGERYLNTVYSDIWVDAHFGNVWHLWEENKITSSHDPIVENIHM